MPILVPPVGDERDAIRGFLAHQQDAFLAVAHGLTDEQARCTPTVSRLSVGGLLKHVTAVQRSWIEKVTAAPHQAAADPRSPEQQAKAFEDDFVMRPDETLAGIVNSFSHQNAMTLRVVASADLDAAVPVPSAPWFPVDVTAWSVRWVLLHLVSELARHAGHADIIRESVDGRTMAESVGEFDRHRKPGTS